MKILKEIIKWLNSIPVIVYASVILLGNIITSIIVTEFSAGIFPIFVFNGIVIILYLLGMISRYIK